MSDKTAWIGIDWATAPARVMVGAMDGRVIDVATAPLNGLDDLATELAAYLPADQTTPVFCSALPGVPASALRPVPARAMDGLLQLHSDDQRMALYAVPGLSQAKIPDLSRGAETVIAGYLQALPDFDGVVCCLGAQTVWAHLSAGEVVSFQSFRTPDLLKMLAFDDADVDAAAFALAIDDIMARPQIFAAALSRIEAETVLNDTPATTAQGRLAGLLIGLELAATRPYWLGQRVVVLGDGKVASLQEAALKTQGADVTLGSRAAALTAGFQLAWQKLSGA